MTSNFSFLPLLTIYFTLTACLTGPTSWHGKFDRANVASTPCAQLASLAPMSVVTAQDGASYSNLNAEYWSTVVWAAPSCIYFPTSAQELGNAVKIVAAANATFAIKGHGHSPLLGFSNINDGVLIDLTKINDITYDNSTQTVRAGFGNSWGDVYTHLEAYDRLAVGARAPTVGLATLLGGGLSHLSNKYGFVSDNAISFELVVANGSMIIATAASNPDVFYALKGGSNNFGIVTHATMRTYPVGVIWGGSFVYTNTYRDQVMLAFSQYQRDGQMDQNSALISYMGINNNTIYVTLVYLEPVSNPAAFSPFYKIPNVYNSTGLYSNFTALLNQQIDRVVPRWTYGTTTFLLDETTYADVGQICQTAAASLATINGGTMVLLPQPISGSMVSQSLALGTGPHTSALNATAMMWFSINLGWNLASDDNKIDALLLDNIQKIETLTKARKLYTSYIFQNDAYSSQNPIQSYGENVYWKLKSVSRGVDPDRVFQIQVPGGFKLGI